MTTTLKDTFNALSKVTEVELVYRNKMSASERPQVRNSADAYKLLLASWDMNKIELQEQFRVLLLDRKNCCMGIATVASGGISDCMVDAKLVFAIALKASATGIILAHNHPSGNTTPSKPDQSITSQLTHAGALLQISVMDHLVVSKESYTSFADEGLLIRPYPQEDHVRKITPANF